MSYRTAADAAYSLACDQDPDVAKLGVRLLSDLANKECYSAMLCLMYLHSTGQPDEQNLAIARVWADRAKALHATLTDADDLRDAGSVCLGYAHWFNTTAQNAVVFFEKAASLGSGAALYEICELTRADQKGTSDWIEKLARAATLGSTQAMVELAEQNGVRGTEHERIWLRAAAALGSLRAIEMLEYQ